jgi:hypothetical protein
VKHQLLTAAIAALFVLLALATGVHRRGAVIGASMSGLTAVTSVLAIGRTSRASKPVQMALAIMAGAFLVRILLVALGTWAVVRSGESVVAFVAGFFVPYFVLAAVEAAYVHSLSRGTGPTA